MNETTRALIDECWVQREHCTAWFDSEKFVELIVIECVDQLRGLRVRDSKEPDSWQLWNQALGHAELEITRYFGD